MRRLDDHDRRAPANIGTVVYVWDYRKRKQSFAAAEPETLEAALDQALQVARDWCDIE